MAVFRENPRIYHQSAPTQATVRHQIINQPGLFPQTWQCARDAVQNLWLLYRDFLGVVVTAQIAGGAVPVHLDDARDLVRLGYWLIYGPMWEVVQQRRRDLGNTFPTMDDLELIEYLIAIANTLELIETRIFNLPNVQQLPHNVQHQGILNDIAQWTNPHNQTAQNIIVLGYMELLLRIIGHTSPNLAAFRATLANLHSCRPRNPLYPRRGLPQVMFVCAGANNGMHVITTSKDQWFHFTSVWASVDAGRVQRQTSPPIVLGGALQPAFNVIGLSNTVLQDFNAAQADVNRVLSDNATEVIRSQVATLWQNQPARFANHANEMALPMTVPDFAAKARCLRCQALFRYNVNHDPGLVAADTAWRGNRRKAVGKLCNTDWDCAETYAHFYCVAANAAAVAGVH
ncbi:hypothetical protein QBC40DRAFT_315727 [Triangularia verruculosa]|uniref:Uncharacterized protein n=1 Tax=Triangularia verruculosa TaxID=2587418 RepID=A0AAN6X7W3_9PEZI|nr:hypothetical protein QBC40DRAFT_315727 [Triangularia verruculosa]